MSRLLNLIIKFNINITILIEHITNKLYKQIIYVDIINSKKYVVITKLNN